jgi:hypothetical protein
LFQKREKSRFFFVFHFASLLFNPIFAARSKNGSSFKVHHRKMALAMNYDP